MRIVFLSRYQNKFQRGSENFVMELAKRLSQNHKVDILAGDDADSMDKVLQGKYQVVIPINGRLQSLKASLAKVAGGYKLLISGHSGIGWDDIWNIVVAKPDVFVALTEYQKNWAKKWAWGSRIVKIPNGVDLTQFNPLGEKISLNLKKPIILSAGALTWYKHHEKIIDAMVMLDEGSLLIAGAGPKRESLEKEGKRLLRDRFKIISFKYEDMPKVYRSCDLFTLPSWDREAFGIVYLEALASGLGMVAPDDEQRKETIGDGGLFANVDDPLEYAEKIQQALSINWAKQSIAQAEKFSWDKISKKYGDLLLEMLKE